MRSIPNKLTFYSSFVPLAISREAGSHLFATLNFTFDCEQKYVISVTVVERLLVERVIYTEHSLHGSDNI